MPAGVPGVDNKHMVALEFTVLKATQSVSYAEQKIRCVPLTHVKEGY